MKGERAIFGVVLVFVLGVFAGSLATHLLYRYRLDSIISGRAQTKEEVIIDRLNRKLDLDPRQLEEVRKLVHETHEKIQAIRSQVRPQTEAIIEGTQARISALLTPEQRVKYDTMIAERKARLSREGHP
jgi:hypothetical protein